MDKTYSTSTYIYDIKEIRESDKVSAEDIDLLTKYIALSNLAGNNLEGKTYEEILDKIKEVRKDNTDESDRLKLEKEAARERMNAYLKVNLRGKSFSKVNNKDCMIYSIVFQNPSSKNIKMVVGSISLTDLLDREIENLQVILDEELKAGATLQKSYTIEYDPGSENDKRIRTKELIDIRVVWNPVKIVFKDGTVAE